MKNELFSLSGKTALVTGGSRGIGFALAKGLANQGADVAIVSRTKEQLEIAGRQIQDETGKSVSTFTFDLANTESIEDFFESIVAKTKSVDILVNCAGTTIRGPAEEVDLITWNEVLQVNLTSAFVLSQAFCQHRRQVNSAGKIINIGSLTCHGARPTTAAYASSKGGLLMLTKTLAVEWARYGITVNALAPSILETDLTEGVIQSDKHSEPLLRRIPMGVFGKSDDVVGAAVYLASDSSSYVTGTVLPIDGGTLSC